MGKREAVDKWSGRRRKYWRVRRGRGGHTFPANSGGPFKDDRHPSSWSIRKNTSKAGNDREGREVVIDLVVDSVLGIDKKSQ